MRKAEKFKRIALPSVYCRRTKALSSIFQSEFISIMIIARLFAFNLFCALIPCPRHFPHRELPPSLKGRTFNFYGQPLYSVVNTNDGRVKGYTLTVMNGRKIAAFEGISYAKVNKEIHMCLLFKST